MFHNGEEREYFAYIPSSYNENANYPVLLNFHAFGGNAKDYIEYQSDFREIAEQEKVILIYPQALLWSGFSVWNAAPFAEDNKTSSDDIGFVEILIDDLQQTLSIDPNRIYATGFEWCHVCICFSMLYRGVNRWCGCCLWSSTQL